MIVNLLGGRAVNVKCAKETKMVSDRIRQVGTSQHVNKRLECRRGGFCQLSDSMVESNTN